MISNIQKVLLCAHCGKAMSSIYDNGILRYKKSENEVIAKIFEDFKGFTVHHDCMAKFLAEIDEEELPEKSQVGLF